MSIWEILNYGFIQKAFLGGIAIALCCGIIGPFLVLKKQSLMGDGIAHLAFGGIALGLLFEVDPLWSALVISVLGSWTVQKMIRKEIYGDAAIALILSLGVGLGVVVVSLAGQLNVRLYHYFIGSILTLSYQDLFIIYGALTINLFLLTQFYSTWFFLTFNEELGTVTISSRSRADFFFAVTTALTVVISIRAVGILLVSALLVIPSLISLGSARSFKETLLFSISIGVVSVITGIFIAYFINIPPSGAIVMVLFTIFLIISVTKKFFNKLSSIIH